ncbi:MAG: hypothetical protein OXG85_11520 [Chloroflexi bacterium]|nr:hypothetical protein [Chloroflexota bacterium]
MKRALCMGLALLLAALAGMPSLAQKRLPAPVIYRDEAEWMTAWDDPDILFPTHLQVIQGISNVGGKTRKYWCVLWRIRDKRGITKANSYLWRIRVDRTGKKPLKYIPGGAGSPIFLEMWGRSGWQTSTYTGMITTGIAYSQDWCGLAGGQRIRAQIQSIDEQGKPNGRKSKWVKFDLDELKPPLSW